MDLFRESLREVTGSYGLIFSFLFFVGAGLMAFRPSVREAQREASMIPLKDD